MWADTRIAWHIQKTVEGSVMHNSVIKYLRDVFAPPTLHLKLKQSNGLPTFGIMSEAKTVRWDTCEGNLDWNPDYICESDFLLHFIASVSPLLVHGMCHPYCYCCVSCLNLVASTSYSSEMIVHDIFARLVHGSLSDWFGLSCLSVPGFWSCFLYGGHVRACLVMMFSPFFFLWIWITGSHLWLASLILLPLIFFFGHLLTAVGCSGHSTDCWRPTLPLCGY